MELTDGFIDETTPYSSWGNMMSENVGGPEEVWDMAHPAIVKDVAKGVVKGVKNAVSSSEAEAKATGNTVGDFIDYNNMPEPSPNWNGDWAALEEYRATNGGRERLQAAYDELSKAVSTNEKAKAKVEALK